MIPSYKECGKYIQTQLYIDISMHEYAEVFSLPYDNNTVKADDTIASFHYAAGISEYPETNSI